MSAEPMLAVSVRVHHAPRQSLHDHWLLFVNHLRDGSSPQELPQMSFFDRVHRRPRKFLILNRFPNYARRHGIGKDSGPDKTRTEKVSEGA